MLTILISTSCKKNNSTTQAQASNEETVEIPSAFIDFYKRFHEDSIYQMEHIVFPLPNKEDGSLFQKEEWVLNKTLDLASSGFQRDLSNFQNIITETLTHEQGLYTLERRFSPIGGEEWSLIYYQVSNPLKQEWEKIEE